MGVEPGLPWEGLPPPGESSKCRVVGPSCPSLELGEGVLEVARPGRHALPEPDPVPEAGDPPAELPPEMGERPACLLEVQEPTLSLFCRWKAMMLAMSTSMTLGRTCKNH